MIFAPALNCVLEALRERDLGFRNVCISSGGGGGGSVKFELVVCDGGDGHHV